MTNVLWHCDSNLSCLRADGCKTVKQWTMRLQQSVIECNGQHNIVKKREEIWRNKVILNCLKIHSSNFRIVLTETVRSIIQPGSLSLRLTEKRSYWVAHHGGTCPWDRVMCDSPWRGRVYSRPNFKNVFISTFIKYCSH